MFVSLFSLALGRLKSLFRAFIAVTIKSSLYCREAGLPYAYVYVSVRKPFFLLPDYS